MTSTSPSEAWARAAAFAKVHRDLLGSDEAVTFGRFTLLRPLGHGAYGRVYLAFDPELQREVALKVIAAQGEDALALGLQEARALARLRHPNLVQIHDVVREDDAIGLAMERLDGPTLRGWAAEAGRREIVAVMEAVGRGLAALHAAGLVHRDIKPSNIIVDAVHGPRIIDLGLAREVQEAPSQRLRSGTPGYLAPEQVDGVDVGPAADQYAWAVVLWEALTGRRPTKAEPGRAVPRGLRRILRRALAERPAARYASMPAMLGDVARWSRRTRWVRLGGVVALGGVAVGALQGMPRAAGACDAKEAGLEAEWTSDDAAAMRERLAGLPVPMAAELAERITGALDAEHVDLLQTQRWVCEQEAQGREADDAAFCLRQVTAEFETTLATLRALEPAALPDAADMVARLQPPHTCRSDPGPRPESEVDLEALAIARGALQGVANGCALLDPDGCRERFDALELPRVGSDCAVGPFATFERGRGLMNAGDDEAAFDLLTGAAWAAESCGAGALEFRAKRYAASLSARRGALEQAQWWLAAAQAAAGRQGETDFWRGELLLTEGLVTALEGKPKESFEALKRSVALLDAEGDAAASSLAVAYVNLGQSARQAGMPTEAAEAIGRSLAVSEQRLGPSHPEVGRTLVSLAIALFEDGRTDAALQTAARAIAVFEPWGEQYAVDLAQARSNRALMLRSLGRLEEAEVGLQGVLDALAEAGASAEPTRISTLENLGSTQAMRGDLDGAAATLADALARARARYSEEHPAVQHVMGTLANVHLRQGAFAEAAALACPVHEGTAQRLGPDHRGTMIAAALCATAKVESGAYPWVVETFTEESTDAGVSSTDRGALRFAVARALTEVGQRARGEAMAQDALADLATDPQGRAEVETWLASLSSDDSD